MSESSMDGSGEERGEAEGDERVPDGSSLMYEHHTSLYGGCNVGNDLRCATVTSKGTEEQQQRHLWNLEVVSLGGLEWSRSSSLWVEVAGRRV